MLVHNQSSIKFICHKLNKLTIKAMNFQRKVKVTTFPGLHAEKSLCIG